MGRETRCAAVFDGFDGEGKLLLETDELIFRGAKRLVVPRAAIRDAVANDGWLEITWPVGRARFEIGSTVTKWVNDILNPKSRIDKLDIKPDSRVAIVRLRDADFVADVRLRAPATVSRMGTGPYDLIFYGAEQPAALGRLNELRDRLQPAGAIWVVAPKGVPAIGHRVLVAAAKRAGMVDTKTARYSDTHTALKLVRPKKDRAGA